MIGIERFGTKLIQLELKDFELNQNWEILNWNWNWIKKNRAPDSFVMLRRIFYRQLGVLLCRQWCLMAKKRWTTKFLVKHYLAVNQWMKLMNGESIRLVLLSCMNECWLGTASKNHWYCPGNNQTFPVSHFTQPILPSSHSVVFIMVFLATQSVCNTLPVLTFKHWLMHWNILNYLFTIVLHASLRYVSVSQKSKPF